MAATLPRSIWTRRLSGLRCSQGRQRVNSARSCCGFIMGAFLTGFNHINLDRTGGQGVLKLANISAEITER
ncbi:hypothetical protein GCM10023078_15730 [Gibbsiella greigii]